MNDCRRQSRSWWTKATTWLLVLAFTLNFTVGNFAQAGFLAVANQEGEVDQWTLIKQNIWALAENQKEVKLLTGILAPNFDQLANLWQERQAAGQEITKAVDWAYGAPLRLATWLLDRGDYFAGFNLARPKLDLAWVKTFGQNIGCSIVNHFTFKVKDLNKFVERLAGLRVNKVKSAPLAGNQEIVKVKKFNPNWLQWRQWQTYLAGPLNDLRIKQVAVNQVLNNYWALTGEKVFNGLAQFSRATDYVLGAPTRLAEVGRDQTELAFNNLVDYQPNWPKINLPQINLAKIELPKVELPKISLPQIGSKQIKPIKTATVKLPQVKSVSAGMIADWRSDLAQNLALVNNLFSQLAVGQQNLFNAWALAGEKAFNGLDQFSRATDYVLSAPTRLAEVGRDQTELAFNNLYDHQFNLSAVDLSLFNNASKNLSKQLALWQNTWNDLVGHSGQVAGAFESAASQSQQAGSGALSATSNFFGNALGGLKGQVNNLKNRIINFFTRKNTTIVIPQTINNVSNPTTTVIEKPIKTVERVTERVETIREIKTIINNTEAATTASTPSQFIQNNNFATNKLGGVWSGDNLIGGTLSFAPGTIIDFSGAKIFNWPYSSGGGGGYSGGGGGGNASNGGSYPSDHGGLTGLADDDHSQYGALAQNETVSGVWTFANGFVINSLSLSGSATTSDRFYAGQISVNTSSPWSGYELAVAGDEVIAGNLYLTGGVTTTHTLYVDGYASTTGGLYTMGSGHIGSDLTVDKSVTTTDRLYAGQLSVNTSSPWSGYELAVAGDLVVTGNIYSLGGMSFHSITTTDSIYAGTYVSSTDGLFTQGNAWIGGNATSSHFAAKEICLNGVCNASWGGGGYAEFIQVGHNQQNVSTTPFLFANGLQASSTVVFDSVTTTHTLYVGGYASTTGGLFTQGSAHIGQWLSVDHGITSTQSIYSGGYVSSTGGLFTQGNAHIGGNFTVDGNATNTGYLVVGSALPLDSYPGAGTITASNRIVLASTTNTGAGAIYVNNVKFLHTYGSAGSNNIFLGEQAGNYTNSGALGNIGIGADALKTLTGGDANTAMGVFSSVYLSSGSNNTAFGYASFFNNSTGGNNSAFGRSALYNNISANNNSAFGASALYSNTTATSSVGIGYATLYAQTTGHSNTALGYNAGFAGDGQYKNTTGQRNIFIGANSGPELTNLENAIAIGASSTIAVSNAMALGGTGTQAISVGINTTTPGGTYGERLTVVGGGFFHSITTTDSMYFGGYASTTGGLFTQGSAHIGQWLSVDHGITSTQSIYSGGYVSSTGGLFTQGNAWIGGNATTTGRLSLISNNDNIQLSIGQDLVNGYDIGRVGATGELQFVGKQGAYSAYKFYGNTNQLKFYINNSGEIGLGNVAPSDPLANLHVAGSTLLAGNASTTGYLVVGATAGSSVWNNATSTLTVVGGGNFTGNVTTSGNLAANQTLYVIDGKVGINTTTPGGTYGERLTVAGGGFFHSITTTDSMYLGGYASTTGGLFTQGRAHIGTSLYVSGNVTTTGNFNAGSTLYVIDGKVGVGTTTPGGTYGEALTVLNGAFFNGSGTTTISNNLNVGDLTMTYSTSTTELSIANSVLGSMTFGDDAGVVSWMDLPITTATASNTPVSYTAHLNNQPLLTLFGVSNGAGWLTNNAIGVNTTTPKYLLSVEASSTGGLEGGIFQVATPSSQNIFTINNSGYVGIGTSTADALLSLYSAAPSGSTVMFKISTSSQAGASGSAGIAFSVTAAGDVYADGSFIDTGADYAEYFYTKDTGLLAGEAVCVDVLNNNAVKRCVNGNDSNIMGIVSTRPAFLGNATKEKINNSNYIKVAMLGQIPALASNENGEIRPGDSLTSASSTPGYLMKANAGDSTVGVALEGLADAQGVVQVMISRKNKSITVEEIEQKVSEHIAAMEIEDEVQLMVQKTIEDYDLGSEVSAIVNPLLAVFDAKYSLSLDTLNVQLTTLSDQLVKDAAKIDDLQAQIGASALASSTLTLTDRLAVLEEGVNQNTINLQSLQAQVNDLAGASSSTLALVNQLYNITNTSSVAVLSSPNLNIDTLVVNQAAQFNGSLVVYGDATFKGKVIFEDHLTVDKDTAGTLVVSAGATSTEIVFEDEYEQTPKIVATLNSLVDVRYAVTDKSIKGFRLALVAPIKIDEDAYFDWLALAAPGEVLGAVEGSAETQTSTPVIVSEPAAPEMPASEPAPAPEIPAAEEPAAEPIVEEPAPESLPVVETVPTAEIVAPEEPAAPEPAPEAPVETPVTP